jgi:hypothetical protein
LVFRNKAKEIALKTDPSKVNMDDPDQVLFVRKQRNYEGGFDGEPMIKLWFDTDSHQYLESRGASMMHFIRYPHVDY